MHKFEFCIKSLLEKVRNQALRCPHASCVPVPYKCKCFPQNVCRVKKTKSRYPQKKNKKDKLPHARTHLPCKWTAASSSKHEARRQQGVVTSPRPLVQSARLLPARLRTAEWRMKGWTGRSWGGWGWGWGGTGGGEHESQAKQRDVNMEGKIRVEKKQTSHFAVSFV